MTTKNPNEETWKLLVLFLRKISEAKGISQQEIANRTGMLRTNINRIFKLLYCPNLKTLLMIAKAINVNLLFEDKEDKVDLVQALNDGTNELGHDLQ